MLTPKKVLYEMGHYSLTGAIVVVGAQAVTCVDGGLDVTEPKFSKWLRGLAEFDEDGLRRIEVSLSALANVCHDGHPWPLNFSSAKMVPLVKKYVAKQEAFLLEKACGDGR
jgi:hypothetical protein